MIDAAAKPPADFLDGDITWLGDYEECLAIHSNLTEDTAIAPFDGEYCLVGIPIPAKVIPNPVSSKLVQKISFDFFCRSMGK